MAENRQPDLFAPFNFGNGATMAQMAQKKSNGGDLRHCAISVRAEALNRKRRGNGADNSPPVGNGAKSHKSPQKRASEIKRTLRELSMIRSDLQPGRDAYQAMVDDARERLRRHHDQYGTQCSAERRRERLALHDKILLASQTHGKTVTAYKETKRQIEAYSNELAKLETPR